MAAYYIMTNYGPMSIQGLKRMSDDKINEILKDAPKDMDTFQEVYEKYSQLVDNIKNIDLSSKQDILTSAQLAVLNGNWQPAGNYLTEHQSLEDYAKKSEVAAAKRSLEEVIYKNEVYGVSHKYTLASPILERIGNLNNHKELPVQSLMRRCLLTDSGEVTYLDPQDSTKLATGENAILDGTAGQVMVEIPEHYRKFTLTEDSYNCEISLYPFVGAHKVNKCYISAYEASLDRTNNKLSSVVNNTTQFRGGAEVVNGTESTYKWDNTYRSLLGRPVSGQNLEMLRTYANNRGSNWKCYEWNIYCTIYWLYTIEYANLNSQSNFNNITTDEGYKQGGLGAGVTDLNDTNMYDFNRYTPFIPCGYTNSLGNNTGIVPFTMPEEYGSPVVTNVPSYRGIENPFGHTWKWLDGVLAKGNGTILEYYKTNNRSGYSSSLTSDYIKIGEITKNVGYIKEIIRTSQGDIMASVIGGSDTTYFCDQHIQSTWNRNIYGFRQGGGWANNSQAGLGSYSVSKEPYVSSVYVCTRLCYCEKPSIIE